MPARRQYWRQSLAHEVEKIKEATFDFEIKHNPFDPWDANWFYVERHLIYGAVIVRRLMELGLCAPCLRHKNYDVAVVETIYGNLEIDDCSCGSWLLECFDVDNIRREKTSTYKILSEIIHSSYIVPLEVTFGGGLGAVAAVCFISPKNHEKEMKAVSLGSLVQIFREFSADNYDDAEIDTEFRTTGERRIRK